MVTVLGKNSTLPATGIVLLPLRVAKGLEFDHVIIPDAQAEVYETRPVQAPHVPAVSRATCRVTALSQGPRRPSSQA